MFNKITLGPITIYMYGLMIAIGFASALFLCNYRGKKRGLNEDTILVFLYAINWWNDLTLPALLYCRTSGNYRRSIYFMGFQKRIRRLWWNYRWNCDKLSIAVSKKKILFLIYSLVIQFSLAQGFGRIGCFCAGCCYGRETHAWYGITFTHSDFAPNGVSLIPTQLISSAGDFLICGVLLVCI